jgi:hypothetical protein
MQKYLIMRSLIVFLAGDSYIWYKSHTFYTFTLPSFWRGGELVWIMDVKFGVSL